MICNRKKHGFSLIEMLLVLGVLSVLLIAAFVIYPKVRNSMQVDSEIKNIALIRVGLSNYFESRGADYSSLGLATEKTGNIFAIQSKIAPSSMIMGDSSEGNLKNTWGQDISIFTTTTNHSGYAAGKAFAVRSNNVPSAVCVQLVTDASAFFPSIQVARSNVVTKHNLNLNNALTQCNSAESVEVTFIGQ